MEEWYSSVRKLKDDSEKPYKTEEFCHHMFHSLKGLKIKDKGKFKQRMGPEFESWVLYLENMFPEPLVSSILNDDDFWKMSLRVIRGII